MSAAETTMVIEHGVTIGGKPLKDHLEAIDHFEALKFFRDRARADRPLSQSDLRNLHRLVVLRSRPDIAGRYADQGRYVLTDAGRHSFPPPAEVPALMGDFSAWLGDAGARPRRRSPRIAAPRTSTRSTTATGAARLLMNLLLIRGGYPPIAVRPADRPAYLFGLQRAQAGGGADAFEHLLYDRLDATFTEYLEALTHALPAPATPQP